VVVAEVADVVDVVTGLDVGGATVVGEVLVVVPTPTVVLVIDDAGWPAATRDEDAHAPTLTVAASAITTMTSHLTSRPRLVPSTRSLTNLSSI
jgi:hypothetical protein